MKQSFTVEGMRCSACSASIERVLSRLPGMTSAVVNLMAGTLLCEFEEEVCSVERIVETVQKAGFTATPVGKEKKESAAPKEDADTAAKVRLLVSLPILVLLMYVAMGQMLSLPYPSFLSGRENGILFALTQFLLLLPILYVYRFFFVSGFRALLAGHPTMDSLVAVGSGVSALYGLFALASIAWGTGHAAWETVEYYTTHLYFDSAAMILSLVGLGKTLEARAKQKTGDSVRALLDLSPKQATVEREGRELLLPTEAIRTGDVVVVKAGSAVPVDGAVLSGTGALDTSALTGESVPRDVSEGSAVLAGSLLSSGFLRVRADQVGEDTTLRQMVRLVRRIGDEKAPIARLADRVSGIFVPVVMSLSLLTFLAWMIFGGDAEFALSCAVSVLVISCPCALGLATPVAITVSAGRCASFGILVKSPAVLERLHKVDTVLFDKTGTLTTGKMCVTDILPYQREDAVLLSLAASLEAKSDHPLARAVCEAGKGLPLTEVTEFSAAFGGVRAQAEGLPLFGGNADWMQAQGIDITPLASEIARLRAEGKTPLLFAHGKALLGILAVQDTLRPQSREAVARLHAAHRETALLTGDHEITGKALADKLGIAEVHAGILPTEKERLVSEKMLLGKCVAMVGDGVNDAPALMRADVGIAMGDGTEIAMESADVVLLHQDPTHVATAIRFSRLTVRNIRQNLFWAFFYNILGIPLAMGLLYPAFGITLNPMIGALAMSCSSLFVVTNALRLRRMKP